MNEYMTSNQINMSHSQTSPNNIQTLFVNENPISFTNENQFCQFYSLRSSLSLLASRITTI